MSSFFLPARSPSRGRKGLKRKKSETGKRKLRTPTEKKVRRKELSLDEEIASDSDGEGGKELPPGKQTEQGSESEEEEETAPEKRLRLAKEYISQLEEEESNQKELSEIDHGAIAHRLREDVLEQAGKLQKKVADLYSAPSADSIRLLRGHQLPVTCVAITPDDKYVYSGSKDCCIIKWNVRQGTKEVVFPGGRKGVAGGVVGHRGQVLTLAVSSDGKFLASGGQDRVVHVWDVQSSLHLHTFTGHRDTVSGLAFRKGTHELFSCSYDRTVKIWNLDEMAYVETLFGHQDCVSSIDCLGRERPVTAGSIDRTARLWKVPEESQLVFNGHKASIDCVKLINEENFITGSQDGSVALWSITKKKPLVSRSHHQGPSATEGSHHQGPSDAEGSHHQGPSDAEGSHHQGPSDAEGSHHQGPSDAEGSHHQGPSDAEGGVPVEENWVTSVTAYTSTDLVASGSNDGCVHLWKCGERFRSLEPCFSIPLSGFINALAFSHCGSYLVAGVGQEHRLGRWWKDRTIKNGIAIIPLEKKCV